MRLHDWLKCMPLDVGNIDNVGDVALCPHDAVANGLQAYGTHHRALQQLRLIELQAKLGYVLLALLGEKRLGEMGYPNNSVIEILYAVLTQAKVAVSFLYSSLFS